MIKIEITDFSILKEKEPFRIRIADNNIDLLDLVSSRVDTPILEYLVPHCELSD